MMARYLLDTSAVIDALRGETQTAKRLSKIEPQLLCLSSVVLAELLTGIEKSKQHTTERRAALDVITNSFYSLAFAAEDAAVYAQLRATMEEKGHSTGSMDLLIAAQAVRQGLTVVTANLREFQRIPHLKCESWRKA